MLDFRCSTRIILASMGAEFSKQVDHLLDEAETYQRAVQSTFSEYAKVSPAKVKPTKTTPTHKTMGRVDGLGTAPGTPGGIAGGVDNADTALTGACTASVAGVEQKSLLDAARTVVKKVAATMEPRTSRLCLRPPAKRDCEYVLFLHPAIAALPSLPLPAFETFIRGVIKRVAVDRGRRLMLFVAGGVLAVQALKHYVRKLPLVGPPVATVVSAVFPTSVLGPVAGVAGALFVEERKRIM